MGISCLWEVVTFKPVVYKGTKGYRSSLLYFTTPRQQEKIRSPETPPPDSSIQHPLSTHSSLKMSEGHLYIKDSRTWKDYTIPISKNAILASDINKINASTGESDAADKVDKGLRVLDPGFNHTASHESKITWV